MARRRWIADRVSDDNTRAWLAGANAEHLARVLRAQLGQQFDIVADGFLHLGTISKVAANEVEFTLAEPTPVEAPPPIHLLLSIFKFDRFEWALEKAVELGATTITPLIASRTEKHLAAAADKRVERWRRIAKEAAQQSRQPHAPEIRDPITLTRALESTSGTLILLDETEADRSLWSAIPPNQPVTLGFGPEGGWTPAELSLFTQHHWTSATLGTSILRAETAVIAALSLVAQRRLSC